MSKITNDLDHTDNYLDEIMETWKDHLTALEESTVETQINRKANEVRYWGKR